MSGNLLDTSVIIGVMRGDAEAIDLLDSLGNDIFIPVIAIGELLYGANKSTKVVENTKNVKEMASKFEILRIDDEVAEAYGQIKNELSTAGNKLPENDIWIAATAKKYGLTLATFDNHFKRISNLEIVGDKE